MKVWNASGYATTSDLAAHLTDNAIDPEAAIAAGVRVANEIGDLPEAMRGNVQLPAIVWPWKSPDGTISYQAQPPRDTVAPGRPKYLFAPGHRNVLNEIRKPMGGSPLVIVEGTKQAHAVAAAADPRIGVYGMAGCYGWKSGGAPVMDLEVAERRDVFVILDADAATNADVYRAGEALAETLIDSFLADSVKFVTIPGSQKAGADDVLASFPAEKRATMMGRWIDAAKAKPAKVKPKERAKADDAVDLAEVERPSVEVTGDRLEVIRNVVNALVLHGNARTLFQRDGVLTYRNGDKLELVDAKRLRLAVAEAAFTYRETDKGTVAGWPDKDVLLAVEASAAPFAPIEGIATSPFVRHDGTVATAEGYDKATRRYLHLDRSVQGVDVPEAPTRADVEAALRLIFDEMLPDFPFSGETAKANALALLLTPFIREQVDIVPLAVVNAHAPGTGKTLFAGLAAEIATGKEARQGTLNSSEEEIRKNITAGLVEGETFVLYDESHNIDSKQLVEKLTSPVVTDRPLGVTKLVRFQNNLTWVACGNNVAVQADMARRHYRIDMAYEGGDPSLRDPSQYRHANIRGWVKEHRRELVQACLTLVRAWYAAGAPEAPDTPKFGSFEQWTTRIAGILHHAGVTGFLADMEEKRSENDYVTGSWARHIAAMYEATGGEWMTAGELCKVLRQEVDFPMPPLKKFDPADRQAPFELGMAYGSQTGRFLNGFMVEKDTKRSSGGFRWRVVNTDSPSITTVGTSFLEGSVGSVGSVGSSAISHGQEASLPSETPLSVENGLREVHNVHNLHGSDLNPLGHRLTWADDPDNPGVKKARLDAILTDRPTRTAAPRNDRFDALLSSVPPLRNVCPKHGDQPAHPRGGHMRSCPVCFPADYRDNSFTV